MARLSSLFGQEAAIGALRRALEADSLPGTYLFAGAAGVGKGALARAFAQSAACLTPQLAPFDACGACDSCRRAEANAHPEIVILHPFGEQLQIWQFWDRDNKPPGVLSRSLQYAPIVGKRRVFVIEQAETLTESAANSLLKVLEEPPPYAVFMLLAPQTSRVLPTILSRSQTIRLHAAPVEPLADFLARRHGVEPSRAAMIASYAEGRTGQAVQMALHPAIGDEINRVLDFAEGLPLAPHVRALRLAESFRKMAGQISALLGEETPEKGKGKGEKEATTEEEASPKERAGRRQLGALMDLLALFYRDLLALSIGGAAAQRLIHRERAASWERLARGGSPERWMRCIESALLARRRLEANANIAMVVEALMMTLLTQPEARPR